jgi:uncharacterized protein
MSLRRTDLYVYRLIPPRPTFAEDMRDEEAAIMANHAEYWGRLVEETGRVVVYGPVLDSTGSWGLAVVSGSGVEEVRELAVADPAVSSGMSTFDVGPMLVAVVPG